ncbi:MAG: phage portal protein [Planctomycetaceae bacterium]
MLDKIRKYFSVKAENRSVSLTDPAAREILCRLSGVSNYTVSQSTVLGHPAVWAGVNYISRFASKCNAEVFKRVDATGREIDKKHPAWRIIRKRANQNLSARNWIADATAAALLHGNSYSLIDRDSNGVPQDVFLLNSRTTRVDFSPGFLTYKSEYFDGRTWRSLVLLPENVIHIRGLGCDGSYSGESVIDLMQLQLSGSLALQNTTKELFEKGAFVQGSIEYQNFLIKDPEQYEAKKKEINEQFLGLRNSQGVMVLQGATFNPWNINAEQMQFLQSKEFDLRLISLIFLLPPHILAAEINSSYGTVEVENLATLDRLDFWLQQWEDELNEKLLTEKEKEEDTRFIEMNRDMAVRMDRATKINNIITQRNNGLISTNRACSILNEEPLKDGLGEKYYIPSSLVEVTDTPAPTAQAVAAPPEVAPLALQTQTDAGSLAPQGVS